MIYYNFIIIAFQLTRDIARKLQGEIFRKFEYRKFEFIDLRINTDSRSW